MLEGDQLIYETFKTGFDLRINDFQESLFLKSLALNAFYLEE